MTVEWVQAAAAEAAAREEARLAAQEEETLKGPDPAGPSVRVARDCLYPPNHFGVGALILFTPTPAI